MCTAFNVTIIIICSKTISFILNDINSLCTHKMRVTSTHLLSMRTILRRFMTFILRLKSVTSLLVVSIGDDINSWQDTLEISCPTNYRDLHSVNHAATYNTEALQLASSVWQHENLYHAWIKEVNLNIIVLQCEFYYIKNKNKKNKILSLIYLIGDILVVGDVYDHLKSSPNLVTSANILR